MKEGLLILKNQAFILHPSRFILALASLLFLCYNAITRITWPGMSHSARLS